MGRKTSISDSVWIGFAGVQADVGPISAFDAKVHDLKVMICIPFVHDSDKLCAAQASAADFDSMGMLRDVPLPLQRVGNVDPQ